MVKSSHVWGWIVLAVAVVLGLWWLAADETGEKADVPLEGGTRIGTTTSEGRSWTSRTIPETRPFRGPDPDAWVGRVVGPDGKGVSGCEVVATDPDVPLDTVHIRGLEHLPSARTEEDGIFRFARSELPTSFHLVARCDAYPPVLHATQRRAVDGARIVLDAPLAIVGRVRTHEGVPTAGARVVFQGPSGILSVRRETMCDAAGRFRLTGLPVESDGRCTFEFARLLVETRDGSTQRFGLPALTHPQRPDHLDVELILDPTSTWSGIVVEPSGRPVANAKVEVWLATRRYEGYTGGWVLIGEPDRRIATSRSGADGRFLIDDVRERVSEYEVFILSANAPGFAPRAIRVPRPPRDPVELKLSHGARIRGRVVCEEGAKVEGVLVDAEDSWWHGWMPEGEHYRYVELTGGRFDVVVPAVASGSEVALTVVGTGVEGKTVVRAEPDQVLDTELVARPAPTSRLVTGRVRDASGRAVAGASVTVDWESCVTDASGRFSVRIDGPSDPETDRTEVGVEVVAEGYANWKRVTSVEQPFEITLQPVLAVTGFVRWRDGAPARVRLRLRRNDQTVDDGWSEADGSFHLEALDGSYELLADGETVRTAVAAGARDLDVVLSANESDQLTLCRSCVIQFRDAFDGSNLDIATYARRSSGSSFAFYGSEGRAWAMSLGAGRALFPQMPIGKVTLFARADGYRSADGVEVDIPETGPVTVDLIPEGQVCINVPRLEAGTDADPPTSYPTFEATVSHAVLGETKTHTGGVFVGRGDKTDGWIIPAPAGRCRVKLTRNGRILMDTEVNVVQGRQVDLNPDSSRDR